MNYRIVCYTPQNGTEKEFVLYDLRMEGRELSKAVLTRSFSGNIQSGQLVFTIHPWHPAYNDIMLSLSTVIVTDDETEIFRGRPVTVQTSKTMLKTYTCEHMTKFLIDVPDIFSTIDDDGNVNLQTAILAVINGYNSYAADNRKIYAPTIPMTGKATATFGTSIYAQLTAWLKQSGYYAKIVRNNGRYELSFDTDTGGESNDFRVVFGENILDYAETVNLNKLYTAVYPIGIDSSNESFQPLLVNGSETTSAPYSVESSKHLIYNTDVVPFYGFVIMYAEIDLKDEASKTRQTVYNRGVQALKNAAGAVESFSMSAVDPRLVGMSGSVPIEGCYYPVTIPSFYGDEPVYKKLTKIVTDMTKPSAGSLTFGGETNLLTDQSAASIITANKAVADAKAAASMSKNAIKPFTIDAVITDTTLTSTKKVRDFKAAVDAGKTLLLSTGTETYTVLGYYSTGYSCTVNIPATGDKYTGTGMALDDALVLTKTT